MNGWMWSTSAAEQEDGTMTIAAAVGLHCQQLSKPAQEEMEKNN